MKESKYLKFTKIDSKGKTEIYNVISKNHEYSLGIIKWYSSWRQYCFYPEKETIFNKDCLNVIEEFIIELMNKRK
jgi:hypothetical protein